MFASSGSEPVPLEPSPGVYDFSSINTMIDSARAHHLHLALLWFGTFKNGAGHYVPAWMKRDVRTYPRLQDADQRQLDGMSVFGPKTLARDRAAFVALMTHLRSYDGTKHTVIMVQVENEPGLLGTIRDHSATANAAYGASVPKDVLKATGASGSGDWPTVFGNEAPEFFSAWSVSRYINSVAAAGKAAYAIPLYVNVWMRYRGLIRPGVDYPSGGATFNVLDIWKSQSPSIDVIGTDSYTDNFEEYSKALHSYQRMDNAPWLSESGITVQTARWTYDLLARGGIDASVFGVDDAGHEAAVKAHGMDNAMLEPLLPVLVTCAAVGDVVALLEERGRPTPSHDFGQWSVKAAFGAVWGSVDPPEGPSDSTKRPEGR